MNYECSKCKTYGLKYERRYKPSDFLAGKRDSLILIVGLNPKGGLDKKSKIGIKELKNYFDGNIPPYFRDFRKVSEKLYSLFGKDKGVAHTDIVKCSSNRFPPKNCKGKEAKIIVNNCKEYLEKQIKKFHPRIVICNGSLVSKMIKRIIEPRTNYVTSYIGSFDGNEIAVILSGFIGRIDNYAKLRLGKEIELYMERYEIGRSV